MNSYHRRHSMLWSIIRAEFSPGVMEDSVMVHDTKAPRTAREMLQSAVDGMDSDGSKENVAEAKRAADKIKEDAAQAAHDKSVADWSRGYTQLGDG